MTTETVSRGPNLSMKERKMFAIMWQASDSIEEVKGHVKEHLRRDWSNQKCTNVAAQIRKKFYPDLKTFQAGGHRGKMDVDKVRDEFATILGKTTHPRNRGKALADLLAKVE